MSRGVAVKEALDSTKTSKCSLPLRKRAPKLKAPPKKRGRPCKVVSDREKDRRRESRNRRRRQENARRTRNRIARKLEQELQEEIADLDREQPEAHSDPLDTQNAGGGEEAMPVEGVVEEEAMPPAIEAAGITHHTTVVAEDDSVMLMQDSQSAHGEDGPAPNDLIAHGAFSSEETPAAVKTANVIVYSTPVAEGDSITQVQDSQMANEGQAEVVAATAAVDIDVVVEDSQAEDGEGAGADHGSPADTEDVGNDGTEAPRKKRKRRETHLFQVPWWSGAQHPKNRRTETKKT